MADDAGPLLARAGLIAQDHLAQARRAQMERGGTLGEQLVLMGAISDDDLTAFYRTRLMVPRVDPAQLEAIPPRVIKRIPRDMAIEFRVIPVAIDGEQNLILAMSDPSNTHAVDEIAFFTGAYVVRTVATQREIADALTRYYGAATPLARGAPRPSAERRRVRPPLTSPRAPGQAAVRPSEPVPAPRAPEADHGPPAGAPAAAGPTAITYIDATAPHARRTLREVQVPREDAEGDTRPIARAIDAVPGRRRSDEPPRVASGEVEAQTPLERPHRTTEPAVIIEIADAESDSQPILLDRPLRPASAPTQDPVVLLDAPLRRRRRSHGTDSGLGELGGAGAERAVREAAATRARDSGTERDGRAPAAELAVDRTGPTQPPRETRQGIGAPKPRAAEPAPGGPTAVGTEPPLASASYASSLDRATAAMGELADARTRDEVIALLVAHLTHDCRRVAFFAVNRGVLRVWSATGEGVNRGATLRLDQPSTFQDIVATRLPFHGPLQDAVAREFLVAAVGSAPSDATVLPIVVRDRVVGLLYGADRFDTVHDDHLLLLARSSGAALERILVAHKAG